MSCVPFSPPKNGNALRGPGLSGTGDSNPLRRKRGEVRDTFETTLAHELGHVIDYEDQGYAIRFENEFRRLLSKGGVSYGQRDGSDHRR